MRNGPTPLSMHLGMTGAFLQGRENAHSMLSDMIRGIQLYQNTEYKPRLSQRSIIWQSGQTTLQKILRENETAKSDVLPRPCCVLVPSLINGSAILDLSEDRSLARWLSEEQGFDVYLLDWGDLLREEDQDITIATLVGQRLCDVLSHLRQEAGGAPVHGLGYCMGGALMLGALSVKKGILDSLTLLAAPWNFHAGEQNLLSRVRFWAPSALMGASASRALKADALQSLFASMDPLVTHKKFTRFASMEQDSKEARLFVAVEDWVNDGKSLPHNIARECIEEWFLKNALYQGEWIIDGQKIDPALIDLPVFIVASHNDRLVDYDSAIALQPLLPNAQVYDALCGHVGMIAGSGCVAQVWQPIAEWMKNIRR